MTPVGIPHVILLHAEAPPKPAPGAPCNGCGVCCLAEPCPLGILISGKRHGACDALRWAPQDQIYRCGAMTEPVEVLRATLPVGLQWLAAPMASVLPWLANRWIAAGQGCDSTLEASTAEPSSTMNPAPTAAHEANHEAKRSS